MKTIVKKIDKEWFDLIESGKKKYELRLADFDIEEGDILRLEEYTENGWVGDKKERTPTGRFMEKKVSFLRKVDLEKWIEIQPEIKEKGFYVIQFD
jgi:ASC-1-like (ASCH) protein